MVIEIILLKVLIVASVIALYWHNWRKLPPPSGVAQQFYLSNSLRWSGVFLLVAAPAFTLFLLLVMPMTPKDFLAALLVTLTLGSASILLGLMLLHSRIRVDDAGITGYNVWGMPNFLSWAEIQQVRLSYGSQAICLHGNKQRLYVAVQLQEWGRFVGYIERHLAHLSLPVEFQRRQLREDGELLAFEGHWQGMYNAAEKWTIIAALVVIGGGLLVTPYLPALLVATFGGVAMAVYPVMRRLMPKPRQYAQAIGNVVQGVGMLLFSVLANQSFQIYSSALGGDALISGQQFLGILLQTLGVATFALFAALWLAKRYCPKCFMPERMLQEEKPRHE